MRISLVIMIVLAATAACAKAGRLGEATSTGIEAFMLDAPLHHRYLPVSDEAALPDAWARALSERRAAPARDRVAADARRVAAAALLPRPTDRSEPEARRESGPARCPAPMLVAVMATSVVGVFTTRPAR